MFVGCFLIALAPIEIALCLGMASIKLPPLWFSFMIIVYSCEISGQICIGILGIALVGLGLQAPVLDSVLNCQIIYKHKVCILSSPFNKVLKSNYSTLSLAQSILPTYLTGQLEWPAMRDY